MMHDNANESNSDIVVLIRVSDVYSENLLSIDLFVDPWQLFNSNNLTFEGTWIAKGIIQESTSGSAKKRRKLDAPSVSWGTPAISGIQKNALTTARGRGSKETFTHHALDSGNIRLLYLLPGETGDQLQGVIIHVPYKSPGSVPSSIVRMGYRSADKRFGNTGRYSSNYSLFEKGFARITTQGKADHTLGRCYLH